MTQFINICLEQPRKVERITILLLKTLISVWVLNFLLINVDKTIFDGISGTNDYLSFEFLNKFSPLKGAIYIILFIIIWIIIWEIIAFGVLPWIGKVFQWIIQLITLILFEPVVWIRKMIRKVWKKRVLIEQESETGEYLRTRNEDNSVKFFFGSLYLFHVMNLLSGEKVGSEILQLIIEHKESDFVKSRIMTYAAILVFGTFGLYVLKPNYFNGWFVLWLFVLCNIVTWVGLIADIYKDIRRSNLIELRLKLKRDLYSSMVDEIVRKHDISDGYSLESQRKKLELESVERKISITRFWTSEGSLTLTDEYLKMKPTTPENKIVLIVTNGIPDLSLQNFLIANDFYFIHAPDRDSLRKGLTIVEELIKFSGLESIDN